jgi:hypothetical protein
LQLGDPVLDVWQGWIDSDDFYLLLESFCHRNYGEVQWAQKNTEYYYNFKFLSDGWVLNSTTQKMLYKVMSYSVNSSIERMVYLVTMKVFQPGKYQNIERKKPA